MHDDAWLGRIRFDNDGLVPVAAQAHLTGELLMLAWADRAALAQTRASGLAHYWSRSRQSLWRKGESSGHEQRVREIRLDCDGDTVLYRVEQTGPACHTGTPTCFSLVVTEAGGLRDDTERGAHLLTRLAATIARRAGEGGTESYTARLLAQGIAPVSQKVGEEAVEVVVAANAQDNARLASESADLLYHLLVLLEARGVPLTAVLEELARRER